MADRILTVRGLNRATLARQMLLAREKIDLSTAIERLGGLQAQLARPPYVGLWTRLQDFQRDGLAQALESRKVLKVTWLRATLHLCTADEYIRFRTTLEPVLTGASEAISKQRGANFDQDKVLKAARKYLQEKPRTFAEISAMLTELIPDQEIGPMRYTVRTHIPLVQVPSDTRWSYSNKPEFALAESWIGKTVGNEDKLRELVFRYLAAFGPASATDMQTWSYLAKLHEVFEELRPELVTYRDEQGKELFDLPDQSLPAEDTPAPVRFLPEFDNILLSHKKRTRIVADEHRKKVFLPGLRVAATILVDGFVAGVWKVEKTRGTAALLIEPFDKLRKETHTALTEEGEQLVRFVEPVAKAFEVRFI